MLSTWSESACCPDGKRRHADAIAGAHAEAVEEAGLVERFRQLLSVLIALVNESETSTSSRSRRTIHTPRSHFFRAAEFFRRHHPIGRTHADQGRLQ